VFNTALTPEARVLSIELGKRNFRKAASEVMLAGRIIVVWMLMVGWMRNWICNWVRARWDDDRRWTWDHSGDWWRTTRGRRGRRKVKATRKSDRKRMVNGRKWRWGMTARRMDRWRGWWMAARRIDLWRSTRITQNWQTRP
jgi:hypothetical protein